MLAETHQSYALIACICNIKSACPIEVDPRWPIQSRAFRWASITAVTSCPNAGDQPD
jgi:hypothetical protein